MLVDVFKRAGKPLVVGADVDAAPKPKITFAPVGQQPRLPFDATR